MTALARRGLGLLVLVTMVGLLPARAQALPAYSRLFQAKYGYRVTCQACHSAGGGSAVNEYGRDFLRRGANLGAFARLEAMDSDADGAKNLVEITAKANPGDPRSTPAAIGDWLAGADAPQIPDVDLKKIFPSADTFAAVEGSLKAAQVKAIEAAAGVKLSPEDKLPTFYFAIKGGKRYAVAEFISFQSSAGLVSVAVAMDTAGVVSGIKILTNPASKAIEGPAFVGQFKGKKRGDPVAVGTDITAAAGADELSAQAAVAVRKAIAMINAVFGR